MMKPMHLSMKILSGRKEEIEKEFNEFKDTVDVYYAPSQVIPIEGTSHTDWYIFIFVSYKKKTTNK